MTKYEVGQVETNSNGAQYIVEDVYTLTPKEMKRLELFNADRVKLKKLSGVGPEFIDCAINGED